MTAISANLRTLARDAGDGKVTAWETDSGRAIAELTLPVEQPYLGLALSPDGKLAAKFTPWRGIAAVNLWDLLTGRKETLKPDHGANSVLCAAFSPDGALLAAGFQFYTVTVWDVSSSRVKREFRMGPGMTNIISVAWAPDGRMLAAGTDAGYVAVWDTRKGVLTRRFNGHALAVRALAFTPDGRTLATGSDDKSIKLWDTVTGQERCTLPGHTGIILRLRFSPDGRTLTSASADGTLRFRRASTDADALAKRPGPKPAAPSDTTAFDKHQAALALLRGASIDERDAIEAVKLANEALALYPQSWNYRLTLAIARYRAGQWQEAIKTLDELDKQGSGALAQVQGPLLRAMSLGSLTGRKRLKPPTRRPFSRSRGGPTRITTPIGIARKRPDCWDCHCRAWRMRCLRWPSTSRRRSRSHVGRSSISTSGPTRRRLTGTGVWCSPVSIRISWSPRVMPATW